MTVNTAYRIERPVSATSRVVVMSRGVPGLVPWDRIRAALEVSAAEPVLIGVVVTSALQLPSGVLPTLPTGLPLRGRRPVSYLNCMPHIHLPKHPAAA